ncbi:hypothetical protein BKA69DRAFT_415296 [Paraphysoderma sedebokerense]|nr:hypothetical protein BKA69DRAFT_414677 [Paraphysoderma sedebokerense]KAI9141315.1 hypothetical protein BKA69DRAFT_415296 [Paraphysoderma sedebokerense]
MSRRSKETSLKELADTVSSSASASSSSIPKPSSEIIIPISIRPPIPQKSPVIARPIHTQNNPALPPSTMKTNDLTLSTKDRNTLSTKIVDWINLLSAASPPHNSSVSISVENLGKVIDELNELKRVVDGEVLVGDVWKIHGIVETESIKAEEGATTTKDVEDVEIPKEKDRTEEKENLVEAGENREDSPSSLVAKLDTAAVENQPNSSSLTSISSVSSTPEHSNVTSVSPPQSKNLPSFDSSISQPSATPIPIPSVDSSSPTEPVISPASANDLISPAAMPSTSVQPQLPSQPKQSILSLMQQEITDLSKESSSIGMSRSNKQWGFIFGEDGQGEGSSDREDVFASLGKKAGKKWFE